MSALMTNRQQPQQTVLEELKRIRRFRGRRSPDLSLDPMIRNIQLTAQRQHRRLGSCIDAWESLIPKQLCDKTRIESLRQGTLHVTVTSSAVAFEIDRTVRAGLLKQLSARVPGAIQRVRTKIGSVEQAG